jgi:hypothetical protein
MRDPRVSGRLVIAGPGTPDTGVCPNYGVPVPKRRVRRLDGTITTCFRHKRGLGENCLKRYRLA